MVTVRSRLFAVGVWAAALILVASVPAFARWGGEAAMREAAADALSSLRAGGRADRSALDRLVGEFPGRVAYSVGGRRGYVAQIHPSPRGPQHAQIEAAILDSSGAPSRIDTFDVPAAPRAPDSGRIFSPTGEEGALTVERSYRGLDAGRDREGALVPGRFVTISQTMAIGERQPRLIRVEATESIPFRTTARYRLEVKPGEGGQGETVRFSREVGLDRQFGGASFRRSGRFDGDLDLSVAQGERVVSLNLAPDREGVFIHVKTQNQEGRVREHVYRAERSSGEPRFVSRRRSDHEDLPWTSRTVDGHRTLGSAASREGAGAPAGAGAGGDAGSGAGAGAREAGGYRGFGGADPADSAIGSAAVEAVQ